MKPRKLTKEVRELRREVERLREVVEAAPLYWPPVPIVVPAPSVVPFQSPFADPAPYQITFRDGTGDGLPLPAHTHTVAGLH